MKRGEKPRALLKETGWIPGDRPMHERTEGDPERETLALRGFV